MPITIGSSLSQSACFTIGCQEHVTASSILGVITNPVLNKNPSDSTFYEVTFTLPAKVDRFVQIQFGAQIGDDSRADRIGSALELTGTCIGRDRLILL